MNRILKTHFPGFIGLKQTIVPNISLVGLIKSYKNGRLSDPWALSLL